jgi:hypothetical protein
MANHVDITFECLPLRSVARFTVPIDATDEYQAKCERVTKAAAKHGLHNTYYLHNARCVFHVTNDSEFGAIAFAFEGTVLTDSEDRRTLAGDLDIRLAGETCDWLTEPIVAWFAESVRHAVRTEFDRYIAAGDLHKAIERAERLQAESDSRGGFIGMGL